MKDRHPPHSEEAERALLGSILLKPEDVLDMCIEKGVTKRAFYLPANNIIFDSALKIFEETGTVDDVLIRNNLVTAGKIDNIGGALVLTKLIDDTPSSSSAGYYADIILDKLKARDMISFARDLEALSYDAENMDGVVSDAEEALLAMEHNRKDQSARSVGARIKEHWKSVKEFGFRGIQSRFQSINMKIGGYNDYTLIAGRPSQGKSILMLNEVLFEAENRNNVLVFSVEMTSETCYKRMACDKAGVSLFAMDTGAVSEQQAFNVEQCLDHVTGLSIEIVDDLENVNEICSAARRRRLKGGADIVWADYLQLMSSGEKGLSLNEEATRISRKLKGLHKRLGVPVVVLSQLSRAMESGKTPRPPKMSDLRDSGALEQDADTIGMLYKDLEDEDRSILGIDKNRNGPVGDAYLRPEFNYMRFKDQKIAVDDPTEDGI